jgi:hypothetical protein
MTLSVFQSSSAPAPARPSKINLALAIVCHHRGATSNRNNSFSQNKVIPSQRCASAS